MRREGMDLEHFVGTYIANEETYKPGEIIIEEGTRGDWIYVILEGCAKVKKRTAAGMVTIDTLKEGAIFGELVLFGRGQEARSATVVASEGDLRVGVFDSQQLLHEYETLSPQLRSLIKALIIRFQQSTEKAAAFVVAKHERSQGTG